jgi:hypothetical protein
MDVVLIKALNDYYIFDHPVEQGELLEHLRQALHLDERDATLAMAELIANDYLQVIPGRSHGPGGTRMRALLRPGPRLDTYTAGLADHAT